MSVASLQINQQQWRQAGARLIEMAIAEFLYEEIIQAQQIEAKQVDDAVDSATEPAVWRVNLGEQHYQFQGFQYRLGHWYVQPGSVRQSDPSAERAVESDGASEESLPDSQPVEQATKQADQTAWNLHQFITHVARQVEVKPFTLAYLIKEMNNTWLAEAHLFDPKRPDSNAITHLPAAAVEGVLRGHPWLIMSKGRMGFGYHDYLSFSPEMQPKLQLLWVAVQRQLAEYRHIEGLDEPTLYAQELDAPQLQQFKQRIADTGNMADDYILLLVHPWQWHHWLVSTYAGEIASQQIIELGLSQDWYTPMQSIRTFSNISHPERRYVKLPLSIFNTAVYRGLPSDRNKAAPAFTQWLKTTFAQDQVWQQTGLILLGEDATVTVDQPCFDQIDGAPYQFKELFGCLWRESVHGYLQGSEQVLSQAALVHRDLAGHSVLAALVQRSGLQPLAWLRQFVQVCMTPLLYGLYRYGLVFSPHGENSLLIHDNGVPQRMVIKDFIDDVNLIDEDIAELKSLPPEADLLLRHTAQDLTHFIFTGLFIVHYRYISSIFLQDFNHTEAEFWQQVADVAHEFHQQHPELNERIQKFDLFRPQFEKICLNRVRLFSHGYADDAERPYPTILHPMPNPIHPEVLAAWQSASV